MSFAHQPWSPRPEKPDDPAPNPPQRESSHAVVLPVDRAAEVDRQSTLDTNGRHDRESLGWRSPVVLQTVAPAVSPSVVSHAHIQPAPSITTERGRRSTRAPGVPNRTRSPARPAATEPARPHGKAPGNDPTPSPPGHDHARSAAGRTHTKLFRRSGFGNRWQGSNRVERGWNASTLRHSAE
jgi:hypothetical protein